MKVRDKTGRYKKIVNSRRIKKQSNVIVDHNYVGAHLCNGQDCECQPKLPKNVSRMGWKTGRRIVEFDVLLSGLKSCKFCGLGPVPLTLFNIVGELQRGLGGYLYVKCTNNDCEEINIVPYGKTHRQQKSKGIPSFVVNTKLGTGWHRRLNSRAGGAQLAFYVLVSLLYGEAQLVDLQTRLVSQNMLTRVRRKQYKAIHDKLFDLWDKYEDGEITTNQLLKNSSHIMGLGPIPATVDDHCDDEDLE